MVGDGLVQSRNFGWHPVLELTCDQMRCPGSKWLLFFINWKNSWKSQNFPTTRTLSARHMAGWKTKNNNSSTTGLELWRNAGPSAFQLQVSVLKSDEIWCAYLVGNCVSLRTFWTPLVSYKNVKFEASDVIRETLCQRLLLVEYFELKITDNQSYDFLRMLSKMTYHFPKKILGSCISLTYKRLMKILRRT